MAAHHPPAYEVVFNPRAYTLAVVFELVAIFIAVIILRRGRQYDFILPVISIIVGVHFFGMVRALGWNGYWWTGAAMCLWPVLIMAFFPRCWWIPLTGLGCAVFLWASIACSIKF